MTREQVEQKIREVLATETSAVRLSNTLFTPTGLFSHLATDDAERATLVDSPLFREALERFLDLQEQEAEDISSNAARHPAVPADPAARNLEKPKSHVA